MEDIRKPPDIRKPLGIRLRALRERAQLSQESAADSTGLSKPTMNRIETGKTWARLDNLLVLAAFYRTPIDELLGEVAKSPAFSLSRFQSELSDALPTMKDDEAEFLLSQLSVYRNLGSRFEAFARTKKRGKSRDVR